MFGTTWSYVPPPFSFGSSREKAYELDGKSSGGGTKASVITTPGPGGKPVICLPVDPPKDPTLVAKPAESSVITIISYPV